MQKTIRSVFTIWGIFILLSLSTTVPLRWSLQQEVFEYQKVFDFFYVGLIYDLKELTLLHFLTIIIGYIICIFLRVSTQKALWANFALAFILYFYAVSNSQFFIERGHFPTGFDALNSAGDIKFYLSYLPLLLKKRLIYPTLIVSLPLIILAFQAYLSLPNEKNGFKKSSIQCLGIFVLSLSSSALAFNLYIRSVDFFPLIIDRETIQTPFALLNQTQQISQRTDIKTWIQKTPREPQVVQKGLHFLGLSQWKENLTELNEKLQKIDLGLNLAQPMIQSGLKDQQMIVWHVILEGFRMDDTKFDDSKAPEAVSPLVSSFYNEDLGNRSIWSQTHTALSFTQFYQAGLRTSQGISASLCGMGTLPFSLSLKRDFGKTDLNCLPKIFHELGFHTQFYYGASPTFDKLNVFFADQKTPIDTNNELNEKMNWKGWGIPDHAFLNYIAEKHIEKQDGASSQYNLILTKTNHSPYMAPPDISKDLQKRFDQVVKQIQKNKGQSLSDEAQQRLLTYMYTDDASIDFLNKILKSPLGKRSIFVFHGDHSTFHESLWDPQKNIMQVGAQVPLTILFPENMAQKRVILNQETFSQNDIPRIIWKLIGTSKQIQSLPLNQIKHSLGGQRMSEFEGPFGKDLIWGVNAQSHVYNVNAKAKMIKLNYTVNKTPELHQPPQFRVPGDLEVISALNDYFNFSFEEKTKQ